MKRLINPLPAGLMPLFKSDLTTVEDNLWQGLTSFLSGLGSSVSFVISGMNVTSIAAGNLTVASGYWWRHDTNEIIKFAGGTINATLTAYIQKGASTIYTKTYKDGTVQNAYTESTCALNNGTVAPATNEIQYTGGSISSPVLSDILQQNTVTVDPWHAPTFTADYGNYGAPYGAVMYKKDKAGFLCLKGAAAKIGVVASVIFTLPVGYRPAAKISVPVTVTDNTLFAFVTINTDGTIVETHTGVPPLYSLNIRIPLD